MVSPRSHTCSRHAAEGNPTYDPGTAAQLCAGHSGSYRLTSRHSWRAQSLPWPCCLHIYRLCLIFLHDVTALAAANPPVSSALHAAQVRDWYVDSFKELRQFPEIRDTQTELKFTQLLKVQRCGRLHRPRSRMM